MIFSLGFNAQNTINSFEYWFDNDYTNRISVPTGNVTTFSVNTNLDVSTLTTGLHAINAITKDNNGISSVVVSDFFYVLPVNTSVNSPKIVEFEYWFDDDYTNKIVTSGNNMASFSINTNEDVSTLSDGLHAINARFKDEENNWSIIQSNFFYKIPQNLDIANPKIIEFEYWFDDDYTNKIVAPASNIASFSINTNEDVSTLSDGLHAINARFKDEENNWSIIQSNFFYKIPQNLDIANPKIIEFEYWFDDDYTNKIVAPASNIASFSINTNEDVSTLSDGLHAINARFKDEENNWSIVQSNFFYKTPNNSIILKDIIAYEYWFNDDYANVTNLAIGPNQIENLDTFVVPENIGLGIGNHYFNIRFQDTEGEWSTILSETFEIITLETPTNNTIKNLTIYPNPTNGNLNLDFGKTYTEISINCYDFNGRKVFQTKKENSINTQIQLNLPSGFYILTIEADNEIASRKIIIR